MRDARDTLTALLLMIVVSLGMMAYGYKYMAPSAAASPAPTEHPKSAGQPKPYEGPVPRGSYDLRPNFFGSSEAATFGYALLNSAPISVRDGKASASASQRVDEPSGTARRTGERSFTFSGKVDPKTRRLTGTLAVKMKVRDSNGAGSGTDIDYRFNGTLSATYTSARSLKGTVDGKAETVTRYVGENNMSPQRAVENAAWEFSGTRT